MSSTYTYSCPRCKHTYTSQMPATESRCPSCGYSADELQSKRATSPQQFQDSRELDILPAVPGYELERELGHGGMGVVYLARDVKLDRPVALKMIRAGNRAGIRELNRFRAEAQAIARLSHPNVVQIYEIGEIQGLPYLALEYVAGGSLSRLIDRKPQKPTTAAIWLETLAHAVHAAHLAEVVHRDLKPANVLYERIGEGETDVQLKLTDFGLARLIDQDSGLTESGIAIGTPSYMSPEQATGHLGAVGPSSDVYALGAILYETLTGRPPFLGATWLDTLSQVRYEAPVEPRRLNPTIPVDLNTICLKCLEKKPTARYSTALALAHDLRAFLDGKPVAARPLPFYIRVWRWCCRHPLTAFSMSMAIVGIVTFFVGLAIYAETIRRYADDLAQTNQALQAAREAEAEAAEQARQDRDLAREQRRRADDYYRKARDAVERYCSSVGQVNLLTEPGLEWLRRDLLAGAVSFFEDIANDTSDSPADRLERGRAANRLARLSLELGELADARRWTTRAVAILDNSAASVPESLTTAWLVERANAHYSQGLLLRDKESVQAREMFALARLERGKLGDSLGEAECWNQLGLLETQPGAAESAFRAALALLEGQPPSRLHVAVWNNLARVQENRGEWSAAQQGYGQAAELARELTARGSRAPGPAADLAGCLHNQARLTGRLGQEPLARQLFAESAEILNRLTRDWPLNVAFRVERATVLHSLGEHHQRNGQSAQAEPVYRETLAIRRELAPDSPARSDELAQTCLNLGSLLITRQPAEAETLISQAKSLWDELSLRYPQKYDEQRAAARTNLGLLRIDQERFEAAETELAAACELWTQLVGRQAKSQPVLLGRASALLNRAMVSRLRGQFAEALSRYAETLKAVNEIAEAAQSIRRDAHHGRALTLVALKRDGDALADWDAALELAPMSVAIRVGRATSLARLGRHQAARDSLAGLNTQPVGQALVLALCAKAARADQSLPLARREMIAAQDTRQALGLLRQAARLGRLNVESLRTDPDWSELRKEGEFLTLLKDLSTPPPAR